MTIPTLFVGALLASAQLVSFDTRDMDISEFFRLIANVAHMNVVLHPAVQGTVNVMVKDAPWEQVLDIVVKNHGLGKEVEGNTIRIAPVAAFEAELRQQRAIEEARIAALPMQTRIYYLNYVKAEDVAVILSKMISPRGSVIPYRPLNAVIVTDIVRPSEPTR